MFVIFAALPVFGITNSSSVRTPSVSPAATCVIESKSIAGRKALDENSPIIGVILIDDVLVTEVTAPIDVFSKPTEEGKQLFNVFTIGQTMQPIRTESGLRILPDYTFATSPKWCVLVVPSSYEMTETVILTDQRFAKTIDVPLSRVT